MRMPKQPKSKIEDLNERWIDSLEKLYLACKPLTYDCKLNEEEIIKQRDSIASATFECYFIKKSIEKELRISGVESSGSTTIDKIDVKEFSDELTKIYS